MHLEGSNTDPYDEEETSTTPFEEDPFSVPVFLHRHPDGIRVAGFQVRGDIVAGECRIVGQGTIAGHGISKTRVRKRGELGAGGLEPPKLMLRVKASSLLITPTENRDCSRSLDCSKLRYVAVWYLDLAGQEPCISPHTLAIQSYHVSIIKDYSFEITTPLTLEGLRSRIVGFLGVLSTPLG